MTTRLATAVRKALSTVEPADKGAAELALTYARHIDAGGDPAKLGPPLLATLDALGLTPKARRAAGKGGVDAQRPASPLDELRARRTARGDA